MKTFLQSTAKRATKIAVRDFYNGFFIQIGVAGPGCAFYFLGYEVGKSLFQKMAGLHHSEHKYAQGLFGGILAEVLHTVTCQPAELLKQ